MLIRQRSHIHRITLCEKMPTEDEQQLCILQLQQFHVHLKLMRLCEIRKLFHYVPNHTSNPPETHYTRATAAPLLPGICSCLSYLSYFHCKMFYLLSSNCGHFSIAFITEIQHKIIKYPAATYLGLFVTFLISL